MVQRKKPSVAARKAPRQARSNRLVEAILEAAVRVLSHEGAAAFTTSRVAERAGVSVGSLYQYFPNKQAILFRLQTDEWEATGSMLDAILLDTRQKPRARLHAAVLAFFRSEVDEAPLRRALGDAAPLYRDSPQAREKRRRGMPVLVRFVEELAPRLPPRKRAFASELLVALMTSLGKQVSESDRSPQQVEAWAEAAADMFLAYLIQSQRGEQKARRAPARKA
ncbi:MAG: TetR family transcriptional regulator [Myxococcales bacterium]